jgi:hypothetical protein
MNEKQAMAFLTSETKRWAHVIAKRDRIKVVFEKSLGTAGGQCGSSTVWYSRKMLLSNLDNKQGLTDLAIHEVIHLKIGGHGNDFQKEFEKWTGDHLTKDVSTLNHNRMITTKKRGAGKTLEGKWKVEYVRYERTPCASSKTGYGIYCKTVKERPMTKTEATKIYKMACSKDYPAWLFRYVSSTAAHGWEKVAYHESVKGGQQ